MKYVTSDEPLTTKNADLGELSVSVEVKQFDSWQDFVTNGTADGTEDQALEFLNSQAETAARNAGRPILRNAAKGSDVNVVGQKAITAAHDWKYGGRAGKVSVAKRAEARDNAVASLLRAKETGEKVTYTVDELLALLEAAK